MQSKPPASEDEKWMAQALKLAGKAAGKTSPNPMVGAVLVKNGRMIGRGFHHAAGRPHAEVEALRDCIAKGNNPKGATLYVTLEPCSTEGRTPPCTTAIIEAGIKRVVVATKDPNPRHAGRGLVILRKKGIEVCSGILGAESQRMNEVFNHWIVKKTPFVTVKAAMTLDGKIATAAGDSKWITGEKSRLHGMKLRALNHGILVGINTILMDDPSLTIRLGKVTNCRRRIILDSMARTPLKSKVVTDEFAALTMVVVSNAAPKSRIAGLSKLTNVLVAPAGGRIDLEWLMRELGRRNISSVLVEGGGEVNASFIEAGLAQRVAFFYAPKILGGRNSRKGVAGKGVKSMRDLIRLGEVQWRKFGEDLFLTARIL